MVWPGSGPVDKTNLIRGLKMHRLSCVVQQYDWGKLGSTSAVARFSSAGEKKTVDLDRPYAEYWFGTHPSGPSRMHVLGKDILLHDWLLVCQMSFISLIRNPIVTFHFLCSSCSAV